MMMMMISTLGKVIINKKRIFLHDFSCRIIIYMIEVEVASNTLEISIVWLGSVVVKELDVRSTRYDFNSRGRRWVATLGKTFTHMHPAPLKLRLYGAI